MTASEMRDLALEAAGFDPEAVGAFVRKGVEKLIEKLEAKKTQYFAFEGTVIDQRVDEDTAAQLKAATELVNIGADVMAMKRRAVEDTGSKRDITIDLSGWDFQMNPTEADN